MQYFCYLKDYDVTRTMRIYQTVQNLKGYAVTIYKSLWEDALDKSFFHILENYDENSGGELEHYATRVVSTIYLGKYNHEIEHEISLTNAMDKKSLDESSSLNPLDVLVTKEESVSYDLDDCIKYLCPMFIKDYKFFKTRKPEYRKLSYTGLFERFADRTVACSMDYLVKTYESDMEELCTTAKTCTYRNFPADRYKKSMDATIEYRGMLNNILMYSVVKGRCSKYFYSFDIKNTLLSIIQVYYLEESNRYKRIEDLDVYCTLSGNIIAGIDELYSALEREVIGAMLARMPHLKVVRYEVGENLILSSPKENEVGLVLTIFNDTFATEVVKMVSKRVEVY